MKTKTLFVFVYCALSALTAAFAQSSADNSTIPQLQYVNGFPSNVFPLPSILDYVWPIEVELSQPVPVPTIQVEPACAGCVTSAEPGMISLQEVTAGNVNAATSATVGGFIFETGNMGLETMFMTQFINADWREGREAALGNQVLEVLRQQHPELFPAGTVQPNAGCAMGIDDFTNQRSVVVGGASLLSNGAQIPNYRANIGQNPAASECSLLDHFTVNRFGGNFQKLDAAVNAIIDQQQAPPTQAQLFAAADSSQVKIDGVMPSTYLGYNPASLVSSPTGTFLGIQCGGASSSVYSALASGDWPFNPVTCGAPVAQVAISPIFQGSSPTGINVPVKWTLKDSHGNVVFTKITNSMDETALMLTPSSFANGAYKMEGCINMDSLGNCPSDSASNDYDILVFLDSAEQLPKGAVVIVADGPVSGNLLPDQELAIQQVLVGNETPGASVWQRYPDLVIYENIPQNSDGTFQDLSVINTNWPGRIRTFAPNAQAPSKRRFQRKDMPILQAITSAATYKPSTGIAPGGIYTFWGSGFTTNDWSVQATYPLATEGCNGTVTNDQGRCEVVFTDQNGVQYKAPFMFSSSGQVNAVAPLGLPIGATVSIMIIANGTPSLHPMTLPVVATDPGTFLIGGVNPAVEFAYGPKLGQLVTADNPPVAGDILALYGTGLGQKVSPLTDGVAPMVADWTVNHVSVSIGGATAGVLYSGVAPGYAGLDQVNFTVPTGASGVLPLVVSVGGVQSPAVMLAVAAH